MAVRASPNVADLQHLVAVVVDDLHGYLAFLWSLEGTAYGRVRLDHAASSISAFRVFLSFSYGLSAPVK